MAAVLTVDFEADWGGRVGSIEAIEKTTVPLLDFLEAHGAQATFFVSTEIATVAAAWIRQIVARGHEIASHGHRHNVRYDLLSRQELLLELRTSKQILEDLTGQAVVGFRTPQFRKNEATEELLLELGYRYDSSSVAVALPGRYAKNQALNGNLPEFLVSSVRGRFPAGVKWMNLLGRGASIPSVFYVHPFDLMGLLDTWRLYRRGLPVSALCFYLARIGDPFSTLKNLARGSVNLRSLLPAEDLAASVATPHGVC
jgi:peptidoglycan/xylan/chitin deacetylase (PgdA/CDA1 family)